MKIESRTISIHIDVAEWDLIQEDIDKIRFGKIEYNYKTCPRLELFLDSIKTIANNKNHKIEKEIL